MKRLSLYLFITVCLTTVLYAVPASPNPFFVTQPDGTQLTLHTMGDEYYHWVETTDKKLENNNYLPFIGKYVLSLWSEKFGLVQHISNTQPNTTIDCSSLPNGIYQLVLTVEGKIVTSSKMLIL